MPYQAIFEIGPISDYIRSTRKTKDLWGASFLFSYLMGCAGKLILESEIRKKSFSKADIENVLHEKILRPNLLQDKLFNLICGFDTVDKVDAGSIPDQFYCELENPDTPNFVKEGIKKELKNLFNRCFSSLLISYHHLNSTLDYKIIDQQIDNYFRFFFITAENETQETLKNAVATRGEIFDIHSHVEDEVNYPKSKSDKCSLCGDRAKVITLIKALRGDRNEHLCAICTIKRGLLEQFDSWINFESFQSTTAIAAKLAQEIMTKNYTEIKNDLIKFRDEHKKSSEANDDLNEKQMDELLKSAVSEDMIPKLSYQFYFSEESAALHFRKKIKEFAEDKEKLWVDHPFFAILALDGDNTGCIMQEFEKRGKLKEFSHSIQQYTSKTASIIKKYHGQLIYCGGEDTLAILHPLNLLEAVKELNREFKNSLDAAIKSISNFNPVLSISAGAVICHHKYPLSHAIKDAEYMLESVAKQQNGKEAIAIRLMKGGSDKCDFVCKIANGIYNLDNFQSLIGCGIPRGFVFKLIEEKEVLASTLDDASEIEKYLLFLFSKTRANIDIDTAKKIASAFNDLIKIYNASSDKPDAKFQKLIDYLYFARFLEGGE